MEKFDDDFPPEGWILSPFHPLNTWKQEISVEDGQIRSLGEYPDKFVYVSGKNDELYNELLISANINKDSKYEACKIGITLASEVMLYDEYDDDFSLVLEVSYDYDYSDIPQWTEVKTFDAYNINTNCGDDFPGNDPYDRWCKQSKNYIFKENSFRIGIRYTGKSGTGVGIDRFYLSCLDTSYSPDEKDKEKQSEVVSKSQNEDGNICGIVFHDPVAPLALIMVLIGCGALLVSRRQR